jgi:hypothetical protein
MYDVRYKVVFQGDVLPGHERQEVQTRLAELFGVDAKAATKLFSGEPHKVKSQLDLSSAKKYTLALAKLGALGYIEQEIVEHDEQQAVEQQSRMPDASFTETGSFDVSAVRAYFEAQEAKKAEDEKTGDHSIFSLDELEDVIEAQEEQEPTGVHSVLNADQIAKMLNSK